MKGWRKYVVILVLVSQSALVHSFPCHPLVHTQRTAAVSRWSRKATVEDDHDEMDVAKLSSQPTHQIARRSLFIHLASLTSGMVLVAGGSAPAQAGEIGRRITEAVTTSALGQSVRQSVVRGAQIMDQVDAQAERWSDRWHLGSARAQQDPRPRPRSLPPLRPLDAEIATQMLECADRLFGSLTRISSAQLSAQVQLVTEMVLPSFVRAGLVPPDAAIQTAPQFNFASYVHFKAYSDLLASSSAPPQGFTAFLQQFERQLGPLLLTLFEAPSLDSAPPRAATAAAALQQAGQRLDALAARWVQAGLVAQVERSATDVWDAEAPLEDMPDLSFTVALDQDVTIPAQVLLQEQGRRLYPAFLRCMMRAVLEDALRPWSLTVILEDYYLDTDYNADPDKFEVKQVLVNINIESAS